MNDDPLKQCIIENSEDMNDLIIMNEDEERKINNEDEYITFKKIKEILDTYYF